MSVLLIEPYQPQVIREDAVYGRCIYNWELNKWEPFEQSLDYASDYEPGTNWTKENSR